MFGASMQRMARSVVRAMGDRTVEIEVQRVTGYDPATRRGTVQGNPVTVNAVIGAYSTAQVGGQVQAADVPVWIPALDVEQVAAGDLVTFDGTRHRVVSVKTHYAGDRGTIYECQVRA